MFIRMFVTWADIRSPGKRTSKLGNAAEAMLSAWADDGKAPFIWNEQDSA